MVPDTSADWPVVIDGKLLTDSETEPLWEGLDDILGAIGDDAGPVLEDRPWDSPNAKTLDLMTIPEKVMSVDAPEIAKKAIIADFVSETGVPSERQSYLALLTAVKGGSIEKYWTETQVFHCKGGNQQLAQKLAAEIGAERILLNMPASEVTIGAGSGRRRVRRRQELHRRRCDPDRPAVGVGQHRVRSDAAGAVAAADGPQRQISDFIEESVLAGRQSLAGIAEQRQCPGHLGIDRRPGGRRTGRHARLFRRPGRRRDAGNPRRRARRRLSRTNWRKRYPNYAEAFVASRFMDWPAVPWTRASYSFAAPGEVTTMGPILHQGLGAGCISPANTPATNSPATWRARSIRASPSPGAWPCATASLSTAADDPTAQFASLARP